MDPGLLDPANDACHTEARPIDPVRNRSVRAQTPFGTWKGLRVSGRSLTRST